MIYAINVILESVKMTSPLHLSINRELESLVIKVFPHLRREDENFRICMDFAESRVHRHTFLSPDTHKIKRALKVDQMDEQVENEDRIR